jgi:hypothetical protein
MIQMQDVVKANLTIRPTGQNLTSECTVIFNITSYVNRPIPYLMGSVCGAIVIYLSAVHMTLILIYEGCRATFHVHVVM